MFWLGLGIGLGIGAVIMTLYGLKQSAQSFDVGYELGKKHMGCREEEN